MIMQFRTKEEAFEWMEESIDDVCIDNHRFAYLTDKEACQEYDKAAFAGCCDYFDKIVIVNGRKAQIGCHFGH